MKEYKVSLAEGTITDNELSKLATWITTGSRLTKGGLTKKFEKQFAEYTGVRHSVFVNSGSSANLLMIYALLESFSLKNKTAIIPAVSWITTLSPFIQLGFKPVLCECDKNSLGVDLDYFEYLCKKFDPSIAIIVDVLGHPNEVEKLNEICSKYDVILLEDACEGLGTVHNAKKLGSFGTAGSFSFYYGHHISTIEGGMVTTNDNKLYNTMLSIRSHGWCRDVEECYQKEWSKDYNIDEIREYYTFYYPGFNLRSTDLNAFLGISQLEKADAIARKREENFICYKHHLADKFYFQHSQYDRLSNFAYGTLVGNRLQVYRHLKENGIETRPLICGSLGRQPFWIKKYGEKKFSNADIVHDNGIYLPNHLNLSKDEIKYICEKFLDVAEPIHFSNNDH